MMSSSLCLFETLLSPLYIFLSLAAIMSLVVPMLSDLAAHGKTRARLRFPKKPFSSTLVVPKSWFTHFYIVGICMIVLVVFCFPGKVQNHAAVASLGLHLTRRIFECRCIHAWSDSSTMHVAGYLVGILHYISLPFVFVDVCGIGDVYDEGATADRAGMRECWGVCVCLWGQYEQFRHHVILAELRHNHPTTATYRIPFGGWFLYVSCPHYLAEIIVYVGFVILLFRPLSDQANKFDRLLLSSCSYRSIALLVWVVTNLSVSAINSHRWYCKTFPTEYRPLSRKAIIPYIL